MITNGNIQFINCSRVPVVELIAESAEKLTGVITDKEIMDIWGKSNNAPIYIYGLNVKNSNGDTDIINTFIFPTSDPNWCVNAPGFWLFNTQNNPYQCISFSKEGNEIIVELEYYNS